MSTNFFEDPIDDNSFIDEQLETAISDQPLLEDVEKRLEIALYYRTLLSGSFFDNTSEASEIVENELKDFVRIRLRSLMGIKGNDVANSSIISSPFNDEETEALKRFASIIDTEEKLLTIQQLITKILSRPQLLKKEAPTLRKETAILSQPVLKKKRGPNGHTELAKKPEKQEKPTPVASPAPKVKLKVQPKFIEVDGQKYQLSYDKDKNEIYIKDGIKYVLEKNDKGEFYFKSISKQAAHTTRLPPLTPHMLEQVTEQRASMDLNASSNNLSNGRSVNTGNE
jgi:hypothetical protein